MMRTAAVAVVLLLAVLLVIRDRLHERSPTVLLDIPEAIDRSDRDRFNLPPSGFEPGHLLFDTLKNEKLQHPPHIALGIYAYRRYLVIPKHEREAVRAGIEASVWTIERWLAALEARPPGFLCIGESHQDSYREFLARRFFSAYSVDRLYLEATDGTVPWLELRSDLGERDVDLLRADIAEVIRVALERNPEVEIQGAEETGSQRRARRAARAGTRDDSIYGNVVASYVPGQRHAAILGALHCTSGQGWLFSQLGKVGSPVAGDERLNLAVMSVHKDLLTREFVRFLRSLGFAGDDLVLADTAALDARVHGWFLELTRRFLDYRTVVLFTGRAQ
ncbi:MAG: hypothetical protein OXC08_13330 [Thiotrichales bacterium]|nr:hypothetical protein [Thiotrichales bacterium]